MEVAGDGRLRFGAFEFDSVSGKLFREGRPVKIEPQPLRVLGALLERPGEIVSREQLRARIWGDTTFVEFDQSLNYCIRQIRLALREDASEPVYIETLPKQGYRFIASVAGNKQPAGSSPEAPADASGTRESATEPPLASKSLPSKSRCWQMAGLAAAVALAAAILWTRPRVSPGVPIAALNVSLLPPPATSFLFNRNGEGGFAISPDGNMLAFVGRTQGKAQLWVRRLDQSEARPVPDSESAYKPFWSPDSRWIAFFTPLKLKKSEVAKGATIDLCDVPPITSDGTWSARGVILWGHANGRLPIQQLSDVGGPPVPVPGTDGGIEPHFLPDGRRFLYKAGYTSQELWLASLNPEEEPRRIGEAGMLPTYSAGHLLSASKGVLMAQPFDVARGEFTGRPFPLNAQLAVRIHLGLSLADFSANTAGMLVYPPQTNSLAELRWRDRRGKLLGSVGAPGEYYTPRISPDGRSVAFARRDGNNSDIWVAHPAGNSLVRLTFDPGIDEYPVWSADGESVTFANDASGVANLYRKAATGTGTIARLTNSRFRQQPIDWSHDGRFLLFTQITFSSEIMVQPASGGRPLSFLGHALGATKAQFNPGIPRWIAYDFDDSGRREIYVQAFEPGKTASVARWQISNAGGVMPRWRGDRKEIFYLALDGKLMAARISSDGPSFQSATPEMLFNATPPLLRSPSFEYDVTPDGQRFLMIEPAEKPEYLPLTLVTKWLTK